MEYADPLSVLKTLPCGSMLYARAAFLGLSDFATYFAIKEEPRFLKRLSSRPAISVRTGLFYYGGVALVPFMMRAGGDNNMLYESWLNYFASGDAGKKAFDDLATQDEIIFIFYDPQGNEARKLSIKNSLRAQFRLFIDHIESLGPWTMDDFNRERENLYRDYPTPQDLWNALEG